jgi:hypothetical protein
MRRHVEDRRAIRLQSGTPWHQPCLAFILEPPHRSSVPRGAGGHDEARSLWMRLVCTVPVRRAIVLCLSLVVTAPLAAADPESPAEDPRRTPAHLQHPVAQPPEDAAKSPNQGRISLNGGFDFTTQYFFRGIYQEDDGVIAQPYFDITLHLFDGDGFIKSIDVYTGIWNSVHSRETGATDPWYELDFFAGVAVGLPAGFTADVSYVLLDTPSGAFGLDYFAEEIDVKVSYDDGWLWEKMGVQADGFSGLQPHFLVAVELSGASDGFGNGGDIYYQFGVEPTFTLIQSQRYPVSLAVPLTFGFGSDYFQVDRNGDGLADDDSGFGFFDAGLVVSMPLSFIPPDYGTWTLSAGGHLLVLGDTTEFLNDTGDNTEIIGMIGLNLNY